MIRRYIDAVRQRLFLRLYPLIRPRVGALKRKSDVRFYVESDNLLYANDPAFDGGIWFYSTSRARLYFRPEGITGRIDYLGARYQSGAVHFEQGETVVDVGANIGEFSIAASGLCNVVAIEPDPLAFRCLERNTKGRPIRAFNLALADAESELTFYLAPHSADSSIIEPERFAGKIKIKAVPLDDVLARNRIAAVEFLKVEAEGAEPEVLRGALRTLAGAKKVAVDVSAERRGESPWEEVEKILRASGFEVWRAHNIAFGYRASDQDA